MSITNEQVLADIAELLNVEPGDVDAEMDLRDQGIDSIRIMELVERWRGAGVEKVDFIVLAEDQRLSRWLQVLADLQQSR
ncbi:phosphopantetheine-binding protein [Kineosporia sp. NBRC 101731]|uniref:phosphopantetheine-binding protein n=1 Tax=Kineosporia sp. NBRC 101731 TaxID=3032199 RepID=UPI0024A0D1E4|nr:phosphopantetheine-binding protein [Kineosporia sp. NBRC 101731]GLY32183.1 hypothetical protein Kisp02_55480 [Kineosporia sp. NBRC 101731]